MALKTVLNSIDEVPEPFRKEYKERDGKFYIDLEGIPSGYVTADDYNSQKAKVTEFRDKNISLLKEKDALTGQLKQFEGVDAEEYKTLKEKAGKMKAKGVDNPDDIQTLITQAISPLKQALDDVRKADAEKAKQLAKSKIRETIGVAALAAGAQKSALDFLVSQAEGVFTVNDSGEVVAAENRFSVEKPGEPMPVAEFVSQLAKQHSYAFATSQGGGTQGGGKKKSPDGVKVLRNPTAMELGRYMDDIASGKMVVERTVEE